MPETYYDPRRRKRGTASRDNFVRRHTQPDANDWGNWKTGNDDNDNKDEEASGKRIKETVTNIVSTARWPRKKRKIHVDLDDDLDFSFGDSFCPGLLIEEQE